MPMYSLCYVVDRFIQKQLQKLINGSWENSVHCDIVENLNRTCGPHIIAKLV